MPHKFIGLLVQVWKVLKELSLLLPFMAAALLWTYLRDIGWLSLFQPSVASLSGLTLLAMWAVLFGIALLLCIVLPSLPLVFFTEDSRKIPAWLKHMQWIIVLAFTATVGILSLTDDPGVWLLAAMIGLYVMAMVIYAALAWNALEKKTARTWQSVCAGWGAALPTPASKETGRWRHAWPFAVIAAMTFSALLLVTPIWVFLELVRDELAAGTSSYWLLIPAAVYPLVLFWPVYEFWSDRGRGLDTKKSLKRAAYCLPILALLAIFLVPGTAARDRIVEKVGARVAHEQVFIVASDDIARALKELAFPMGEVSDKNKTVRGWVRFSFGDVLLLCKGPWRQPGVPLDPDEMPRELANRCLPMQRTELREWRGGLFASR
ncbi:hypothetical protein D3C86_834570 [compost metagenome]